MVIPFISSPKESPQEALFYSDIYLYVKLKNSPILQPIKMLIEDLETHEQRKVDISIDDKKYYSSIKIIRKENEVKLLLGESFFITVLGNNISKLNYKNSDKIRVLERDLEFILHQIEKRYFLFNGVKIEFESKDLDLSNFNIEEQKNILKE